MDIKQLRELEAKATAEPTGHPIGPDMPMTNADLYRYVLCNAATYLFAVVDAAGELTMYDLTNKVESFNTLCKALSDFRNAK